VFRHTLLYGRALGELVQFLPHCAHFKLRADCVLRGQVAILDVQSGDPIFPAEEPKPFDSKLEERFARDLKRAAPDWDLVREPEPVPAGHPHLPRFSAAPPAVPAAPVLRRDPGLLVGGLPGCASSLSCARPGLAISFCAWTNLTATSFCRPILPSEARIVRFRRRIDPRLVLAAAGEEIPIARTGTDPRP
jgi:hypothetical protein